MKILPFRKSTVASLGIEIEYQIIDPETYDLTSRAKEFLRDIQESPYQENIKPEITQSMIEVNSSIHSSVQEMSEELFEIRDYLFQEARKLEVYIAGGGTHPFQMWAMRKIFPTRRFKNKSRLYRYLSKRSTVFGQHIHMGCESGDDAIFLTHALARYVPHFIAISASSPFYQGIDTGYHSSRSNVFNAFPLSGVIPYLTTWNEFSEYYYKLKNLNIIETMKDFYWDVRPKPEFGTVELRVCDTPLTLKKSIQLAAYAQSLAHYLLQEKPNIMSRDLYHIYNYNKFQAARYGFEGDFIDPVLLQHRILADDMMDTMKIIEKSANDLKNMGCLAQLIKDILNKSNDATKLRNDFKKFGSLQKVVHEQCRAWAID